MMGCPITTHVPNDLKKKNLDYLDTCKDYLKNPVVEKGSDLPYFMDFSHKKLIRA
jgi:hypothetical protein